MGNDPTPVLFQNNTHPLASKLTVSWDAENIKASEIGIGTNKAEKRLPQMPQIPPEFAEFAKYLPQISQD